MPREDTYVPAGLGVEATARAVGIIALSLDNEARWIATRYEHGGLTRGSASKSLTLLRKQHRDLGRAVALLGGLLEEDGG